MYHKKMYRNPKNAASYQRNDNTRSRGRTRPHNRGYSRSRYDNFDNRSGCDYATNEWKEGNSCYLDEDSRNYFLGVTDRLQVGFESKEEEGIFVLNVLAQTEGKEVLISCNKLGSQCLQQLLQLTNTKPEVLLKFIREFNKDLVLVCTHHFASHVVETVLKVSFKYIQQYRKESDVPLEEENENSTFSELMSWVLAVGNFALENLDGFLYNLYGSHVLSSLLQIFGGQNIDENVARSKRSREYNKRRPNTETGEIVTESGSNQKLDIEGDLEVPEEFFLLLKKIAKEFCQKDLHNLSMDQLASPVLQALLIVSSKSQPKMCQKILKTIIKQAVSTSNEEKLSSFLTDRMSSHVMERVITLVDEKRKLYLWKNLFQNRLKELALHPIANFVLQRYHSVIEDSEIEEILNEIGPFFEEILSAHHFGVVASLGETCKRLKTGQAFFTKSIMSALHCWEPKSRQKEIVPLLLHMVPYDDFIARKDDFRLDQNNRSINLHGSLILQHMLWFNKPLKITSSLLCMNSETLRYVVCDAKGSHVTDALFRSPYVGENIREKMIQLLKSELVYVACHKNGSRSLDTIWEVTTLKQKRMIAEELSKKEHVVGGDLYGRFFAQKIGLSYFKHRLKDWEQAQSTNTKKRKLFEDIIGRFNPKTL